MSTYLVARVEESCKDEFGNYYIIRSNYKTNDKYKYKVFKFDVNTKQFSFLGAFKTRTEAIGKWHEDYINE